MLKPLKIAACAEEVWFISDLHYGHTKLVESRGFKTIEEHNDTLVARWNERVTDSGTVFHLGDLIVGAGESSAPEFDFWRLLHRLRFKHLYLLWGNHPAKQHQAYKAAVRRQFPSLADADGGITAEVYPESVDQSWLDSIVLDAYGVRTPSTTAHCTPIQS